MVCCIRIEKLSLKLLYPLGMTISLFVIAVIEHYSNKDEVKDNKPQNFNELYLFKMLLVFLGKLSVGIFFLIQKTCLNKKKANYKLLGGEEEEEMDSFNVAVRPKRKTCIYPLVLLATLFDLSTLSLFITRAIERDKYIFYFEIVVKASSVFFLAILCHFCLRYKYYRHHYLSIILIFLGMIPIIISQLSFKDIKPKSWLTTSILFFSYLVFCSIKECIEKYLMEIYFLNPFKLVFFEGIIGTIIMAIAIACFPYLAQKQEQGQGYSDIIQTIKGYKKLPFLIPLFIIVFSLNKASNVQTNYEFSPTHRCIADNSGMLLRFIFFFNQKPLKGQVVIENIILICYFVILFFSIFLFHEFISINVCGINKDNYKTVLKREQENRVIDDIKQIKDLSLVDNNNQGNIMLQENSQNSQ